VALCYLVVMGSVVAFGAYSWLLRRRSLTAISTYAFVNPIVAVVLGWAVGGEVLDGRVLASAALVVGAVVLILSARTAAAGRSFSAVRTERPPRRTVAVPQGVEECA
jgi:drug/metabolite transporter (DMT)-like permease